MVKIRWLRLITIFTRYVVSLHRRFSHAFDLVN
jgi:hypothetical protein